MVLTSCRSVSPPAPGVPNSSGTSVSATDQRIPRLRSHTGRSVKPTAGPQTLGPQTTWTYFWLTVTVIMFCASARPCVARSGSALTPPLQLTYHGSFLQGSKTIRASRKSSHFLPSPMIPPWTDGPAPPSPSLGRGRPRALGPRAPLKGQATNPSRHFRSSSQSHSTLTRTPDSRRPS